MKTAVIVLFALFALALSQGTEDFKKPMRPPVAFCRRRLDINEKQGGKTVEIKAAAVCATQTGKRGGLLVSEFSVAAPPGGGVGTPRFGLSVLGVASATTANFRAAFALDRIIAYREGNGVAGFQPGTTDVVLGVYSLRNNNWGNIVRRPIVIDSDTTLHDFSSTLSNIPFANFVKFGFQVATDQVSVKNGNSTVSRTIITPNSFKVNFDIDGLKWKFGNVDYSSATGLAIGTFVITKKNVAKRPTRSLEQATSDGERVDQNTADQEVADIDDEETSGKGGFFSWKKFIFGRNGTLPWNRISFISSTFTSPNTTESTEAGEVNIPGYTATRIWFSTTSQVETVNWDPAMGAAEDAVVGAAPSVRASLWLVVAALSMIVTFFF